MAAAFRLILGFWLCALASAGQVRADTLGQPYFESIAGTANVGNGVITIISQDNRGLLWFGTPEGLYSHDGHRFRVFRNRANDPTTIGDDYVRALLPHSDGTLWVATQGAGLSVYDPRTDRFTNHRPRPGDASSLPSVATLALAEGSDGDVWVGFGNLGMARWNRAAQRFEGFPPEIGKPGALQHEIVRCLVRARNGDLWIGTGNGLQRRRAGSQVFERIASDPAAPDSLDGHYVYALLEGHDGRIWIGTQSHGAAVLDPSSGQLRRLDAANALSHPWVSGFVEPRPGRIWVHTYGGGIDVIDAATLAVVQRIKSDLSIPGGLALDRLTAPFQDRAGLVWVGTWGSGLQRHNPGNGAAFRTLRHSAQQPNGLSIGSVLSTLPIDARTLMVGTGGNGIDIVDLDRGVIAGHRAHPSTPGSLRDGTIRALVRDAEGSIWVGTQQAGLQRYTPATSSFSEPVPGISGGPIRALLPIRGGLLVIGTQAGLQILDPRSGAIRSVRLSAERAFTDPIWSLAEDAAGQVWIGTPNMLVRLPAGAQFPVRVESAEVALRAITDLHLQAADQLYAIGPRGIGRLVHWAQGQPVFEDFGATLGPQPAGFGQQLLPDARGRLWSARALIDPVSRQVEPVGVADGVDIGSVETGSGSISPDGLLFFGGTRGLLIIDPERFMPWRFSPPLLVTSVEVDGQVLPHGGLTGGIELRPGQRRLNVEFAALDYSAPDSVRYAFRLVGLDEDWIETDAAQRIASYHNLWPGDYRLEVRARARNGPWGVTPLVLPVTVIPTWWQTPMALGLALLGLLLSGYGGVRLRTLQMRRRAHDLEALVERRTSELSQAKVKAEGALAELKGTQRQLVAAEKMASLGQLVAGVAHEINTPVGIAITAASHLEELAREGAGKLTNDRLSATDLNRWKLEVAESSRLILTSLLQAGTLIASFKQVSVDQSSDQRRQFALKAFLNEVQTTLTPTLRRTRHQLVIECSDEVELDSYPGALFQILTNLVNNALLHAFEGERPGTMLIRARAEGELLELVFSDDGRGMDAETALRAFDPFFTTRRSGGGSGLGLHIVHNLVTQLLAGDIELDTAPGQGTRFTLRFARVTPEARAGARS